jgi:hypothetical protein
MKLMKLLKALGLKRVKHREGFSFELPSPTYAELKKVQQAFARVYGTQDGKVVIEHLQRMTFMRALQPDIPEGHMRHIEGQRALVAQVLRYVVAGQQP